MAVLTELMKLAESGNLTGLAYIAEVRGEPSQKFGFLASFDTDPFRGMAACSRMWDKLRRKADSHEDRSQAHG